MEASQQVPQGQQQGQQQVPGGNVVAGNHPTYQEVQETLQRAVSPPGQMVNEPGAGNQLELIKQVLEPIEKLAEATQAMAGKKEGCDPAKARTEESLVFSGKENTMPLDV